MRKSAIMVIRYSLVSRYLNWITLPLDSALLPLVKELADLHQDVKDSWLTPVLEKTDIRQRVERRVQAYEGKKDQWWGKSIGLS